MPDGGGRWRARPVVCRLKFFLFVFFVGFSLSFCVFSKKGIVTQKRLPSLLQSGGGATVHKRKKEWESKSDRNEKKTAVKKSEKSFFFLSRRNFLGKKKSDSLRRLFVLSLFCLNLNCN